MSCRVIYISSDTRFLLEGVRHSATGLPIADADVELTLFDADDVEIAGETWPVVMTPVTGSDGDYEYTLPDTLVAEDGDTGTAVVTIDDGNGLQATLRLAVSFEERDDTSLYWTSRSELDLLFGSDNVDKWADLDNDGDASKITDRIDWAVREATEDARLRLVGSPVVASRLSCAPRPLRIAVTKLAGVLLYEARGVVDTSDEEGRHRLTTHRKQAEVFFRNVRAGQLVVSDHVSAYPRIVSDDS